MINVDSIMINVDSIMEKATESNTACPFVEKHDSNRNRPVIQETYLSPKCQQVQEI